MLTISLPYDPTRWVVGHWEGGNGGTVLGRGWILVGLPHSWLLRWQRRPLLWTVLEGLRASRTRGQTASVVEQEQGLDLSLSTLLGYDGAKSRGAHEAIPMTGSFQHQRPSALEAK